MKGKSIAVLLILIFDMSNSQQERKDPMVFNVFVFESLKLLKIAKRG